MAAKLAQIGVILVTLIGCGLVWWVAAPNTPASEMSVTRGNQTTTCTIWRC